LSDPNHHDDRLSITIGHRRYGLAEIIIAFLFLLLALKALGLSKPLLNIDPEMGNVSFNIDLGFISSMGLFAFAFSYIYKFQGRVTAIETKLQRIERDIEKILQKLD
jgi:hypothetical protein